jgi:hypothetical protein
MDPSKHFEAVREAISDENPEALFMDAFEGALIGFARRCGQPTLAVYDYGKCLGILVSRDGMSYEEAIEYIEFTVVGAWAGEHTPIMFCSLEADADEEE